MHTPRAFTLSVLCLGATAQLQYSTSLLPSNPGGAIPVGINAPSDAGFLSPTIHPSRGGLAVCVSGIVPVTAQTSQNVKFDFQAPQNQTGVADTFLKLITAGGTFVQGITVGPHTVNGTFDIAATLCTPANDTSPNGVQLLTHGVPFDRYYWDFAPGYSYVDVAAKNGWATLSYDRLGVGQSAKPDGVNIVQAPLEVEIAHSLARALRNGTLGNTRFDTVVGVGHSFGSIITQAVTSQHPSALDAAVLTGFTTNSSGVATFILSINLALASVNQPYRYSTLADSYLVAASIESSQLGFFRAPTFDPAILAISEATKGTVTYGEFFTQTIPTAPAANFTGPVAVVIGGNDLPFCSGNCSYPTNQAAALKPALYANLPEEKFATYLAPATGHGLNLHYSAVAAYTFVHEFLNKQGLSA
ncbi:alpha/beta-hydrolase [Polychaeton citri CBS 116435]|uniref:Alpha/beta-hydrolase n=1 Tax=Polychaeton citri CBS 116435 TaxID=1314669 RepID=A0A9P4Q287_9PEZI|nr:alpha/beta-hydrolase [Polychaeton citri CBS 116435]